MNFFLALHACDLATDEAIIRALATRSDYVAFVPCCQAEIANLLKSARPGEPHGALFQHAWHRREFGAHLTNVIRALVLQSKGYDVTVTELAGWEHAVKNELILGRRVGAFHRGAESRLAELIATYDIRPWLVSYLADAKAPQPECIGSCSADICEDSMRIDTDPAISTPESANLHPDDGT